MGGVRFPARWHHKGHPILYAAEHPAGALAEFLAHIDLEDIPDGFQLLTLELPDGISCPDVDARQLPEDWTSSLQVTRSIGSTWLAGRGSLLLRVPSVLVPQAFNVLVNPQHPDAGQLQLARTERVPLDPRLTRRG